MEKIKIYLLVTIISFLAINCTGIYEDGEDLAKARLRNIKEISVEELKTKIKNNEEMLMIDVRQLEETYKGKIEGSVIIPRGTLELKIANEDFWTEEYMYPPLKDSTEIIIYCKSGKRGVLATQTLLQLGYTNVKNLTGGYSAFNPNPSESDYQKKSSGGCGG